jgi:hypothetical protein
VVGKGSNVKPVRTILREEEDRSFDGCSRTYSGQDRWRASKRPER